jgi:hypothetical protein
MFVCRYVSLLNTYVCRYVVCISFAFTPIAGVQSCAVSNVTAAVAVCCLPCLFSGNLVDFPFCIYVTVVDVTAGVSGFEGGEVVFEVFWQFNI